MKHGMISVIIKKVGPASDVIFSSIIVLNGFFFFFTCFFGMQFTKWVSVQVEEAVFQYLLDTEDFQEISGSPFSKSFFKFAVENGNIDGILQFAVRHKQ